MLILWIVLWLIVTITFAIICSLFAGSFGAITALLLSIGYTLDLLNRDN